MLWQHLNEALFCTVWMGTIFFRCYMCACHGGPFLSCGMTYGIENAAAKVTCLFFFRRFQGRSWHLHLLVLHTPAIPLHVSVLGAVISWVLFPINVGLFIQNPTGYSTMNILRINIMSLWCKHITCIQDILSLPKLPTCFPCTLLRLVVVLTISGLICRNTILFAKQETFIDITMELIHHALSMLNAYLNGPNLCSQNKTMHFLFIIIAIAENACCVYSACLQSY